MIEHFKNPQEMVPGTSMPPVRLSDAQLNTLAAFLLKLTPRNAEALRSAPQFAVRGALLYEKNNCGVCHQVNGIGGKLGPPLNSLSRRRSAEWVEGHFREPRKFSPGTIMPPYRFTPEEMETMVAYLFTIPE
jgi:cbb3-type cytochrome oxidase cytochrome c subunit